MWGRNVSDDQRFSDGDDENEFRLGSFLQKNTSVMLTLTASRRPKYLTVKVISKQIQFTQMLMDTKYINHIHEFITRTKAK